MEKALKAALYVRDANSSHLKEHRLVDLASAVGDAELKALAMQLERRVGNHMRMRYPDLQMYPRIPADLYDAEDANLARYVSTCALSRVKNIIYVSMLIVWPS